MRKRIFQREPSVQAGAGERWIDLAAVAQVEVSSEHPDYPIENALLPGTVGGWKAGERGAQTIRLLFDIPLHIDRVELRFLEEHSARTQQFTLRWRSIADGPMREIVRQSYNFSHPDSTRETERYEVELDGVRE